VGVRLTEFAAACGRLSATALGLQITKSGHPVDCPPVNPIEQDISWMWLKYSSTSQRPGSATTRPTTNKTTLPSVIICVNLNTADNVHLADDEDDPRAHAHWILLLHYYDKVLDSSSKELAITETGQYRDRGASRS
jgi:hypothetical protein